MALNEFEGSILKSLLFYQRKRSIRAKNKKKIEINIFLGKKKKKKVSFHRDQNWGHLMFHKYSTREQRESSQNTDDAKTPTM